MITLPSGTRIWLAAGATDMRRGFDGLAALVQLQLSEDPFSGQLFVFRGRRGDRVKILWWDGDGLCLFAKRLERGHFVWPQATSGSVHLTPAQLSMLLEGIDWRRPTRAWQPLGRVMRGVRRAREEALHTRACRGEFQPGSWLCALPLTSARRRRDDGAAR